MTTNLNAKRMVTLTTVGLVLLFCPFCQAQEKIPLDSADYWCGAFWPPEEGKGRTFGIDVNGDVCIKIAVETSVEIIDVIEIEVPAEVKENEITVVLKNDENGNPIMTASCLAVVETNQYDAKIECIKAGRKMKLYTRNGNIYSICEK